MPYIEMGAEGREGMRRCISAALTNAGVTARGPGALTAVLCTAVDLYLSQATAEDRLRYKHLNDVLGALSATEGEFKRRVVDPYEAAKLLQNGDVFVDTQNLLDVALRAQQWRLADTDQYEYRADVAQELMALYRLCERGEGYLVTHDGGQTWTYTGCTQHMDGKPVSYVSNGVTEVYLRQEVVYHLQRPGPGMVGTISNVAITQKGRMDGRGLGFNL